MEKSSLVRTSGILFAAAIRFYIAYFVLFKVWNGKNKEENRKSIKNCFGYEIYSAFEKTRSNFLFARLCCSCLFYIAALALLFFGFFSSGFRVVLGVRLILSSLALTLSNCLSFQHRRLRLVVSLIGFAAFDYAAIGLAVFKIRPDFTYTYENSFIFVPVAVVFGLLALLGVFCFANPKFYTWFKRNRIEEDGTTRYEKPKWNYYAFYEWCFLLGHLLSALLFAICCFIYIAA